MNKSEMLGAIIRSAFWRPPPYLSDVKPGHRVRPVDAQLAARGGEARLLEVHAPAGQMRVVPER
jgi:hypothetical protein